MGKHGCRFDNDGYHYSDCTEPYCNCDERRYGTHSNSSETLGWILIIFAFAFGIFCPPIGFLIMLIFVFGTK